LPKALALPKIKLRTWLFVTFLFAFVAMLIASLFLLVQLRIDQVADVFK